MLCVTTCRCMQALLEYQQQGTGRSIPALSQVWVSSCSSVLQGGLDGQTNDGVDLLYLWCLRSC